MKLKIKHPEEFKTSTQALANELVQANVYFTLRKDLIGEIREYEAEMNLSATFWALVLDSLLDTTLISLCRIYDSHNRSNSLLNLLDTVKENVKFCTKKAEVSPDDGSTDNKDEDKSDLFQDEYLVGPDVSLLTKKLDRVPDLEQLDRDIESVSRDNPLIKNLYIWRNTFLAHKDSHNIINKRDISEDYSLTLDDISNLLENGLIIINRYSELFLDLTYHEEIIRRDDYQVILHSLRRELDSDA